MVIASIWRRVAITCAMSIALAIGGCAAKLPGLLGDRDIGHIRQPTAEEPPVRIRTTTAALLDYVGTRLRLAREPLVVIGYNCSDNGKGVTSQVELCRDALHAVAAQAPNQIIVSSVLNAAVWGGQVYGVSTVPQDVHAAPFLRDTTLALPTLVLDGGPVTSLTGLVVHSNGKAISASEIEAGKTQQSSVDAFEAKYTLRLRMVGSDVPGATNTVRITTQDRSASIEAGAYVSAQVNGKRHGAGLRLSAGKAEVEDAATKQRVAAEIAIAQILADYFHIDLSECPCLASDGFRPDAELGTNPDIGKLRTSGAAQLSSLPPPTRESLARAALKSLGYLAQDSPASDADGFRSAVLRFRRDEGLVAPPSAAAGLGTDDLVYMRNAVVRRLSAGVTDTAPTFGGLDLTMFSGSRALTLNSVFSVMVNVPVAGHLTCAYKGDQVNKWYVIFPNALGNTLTAVSRRSPVEVPSNPGNAATRILTLTELGGHRVYCVETTAPLALKLNRDLDFLGAGVRMTDVEMSEYLRKQAGSSWITDGQIVVNVVPAPKSTKVPSAPIAQDSTNAKKSTTIPKKPAPKN